jgi:hypothetical protein
VPINAQAITALLVCHDENEIWAIILIHGFDPYVMR